MSFNQSVLLPVSPDEAFALVTEPERIRRWLAVSAYIDLRAGGDFRWTVATGNHAAGTVREVEPGRRLVLAFGWDEDEALPPGASTVTIVIEPAPDGSQVTLTHEGLNEEQTKQHAEGWEHYLERLQKVATDWRSGTRRVRAGAPGPQPGDSHRVGPVRRTAGPAPPRPGGPSQADAVRGLRRQRPLPPPDGLTGPARGAGRRHRRTLQSEGTVENQISLTAGQAIDAWRAVDLDGTLPGPGGGEVPASDLAGLLPVELALHGWDFAQTCGVELDISDEVVAYLRTLAQGIDPVGRENGSFKAAVTAPEGASAIDQLAAFAGRTPMHH